jgi:Amt family ammonium transporter
VAGLVVITPAAGFTTPMYALLMGLAGGVVCFLGATVVKHAFGYDDSLDAFGVHGLGGTLGAILTGVFAVGAVNGDKSGLLEGNTQQFLNQIYATLITWAIAGVGTFVLLKIVDVVAGLRVSEADEYDGLDLSQHGEAGYNLEDGFGGTLIDETPTAHRHAPAAATVVAS